MIDVGKLLKSFTYAFAGIKLGLKVDQNLRLHSIVGSLVLGISLFLHMSKPEFFMILLAIFFVWFAELVNTAIEEMTNLIIQEHRQEAKIAKDVGAAAVLLSALYAVLIGIFIFLPALFKVLIR